MTDERRAELNAIKLRLQGLLILFTGNQPLIDMVNSMIAGVSDELA